MGRHTGKNRRDLTWQSTFSLHTQQQCKYFCFFHCVKTSIVCWVCDCTIALSCTSEVIIIAFQNDHHVLEVMKFIGKSVAFRKEKKKNPHYVCRFWYLWSRQKSPVLLCSVISTSYCGTYRWEKNCVDGNIVGDNFKIICRMLKMLEKFSITLLACCYCFDFSCPSIYLQFLGFIHQFVMHDLYSREFLWPQALLCTISESLWIKNLSLMGQCFYTDLFFGTRHYLTQHWLWWGVVSLYRFKRHCWVTDIVYILHSAYSLISDHKQLFLFW